MNLKELYDKIGRILKSKSENKNLKVTIPIQGLSGSYVDLKSISIGFDWHSGQLCLNAETRLSRLSERDFAKTRKIALYKLSNLRQINDYTKKPPYEAKFKTKKRVFERRADAINWIYEMLEEEIEKTIA